MSHIQRVLWIAYQVVYEKQMEAVQTQESHEIVVNISW